MEAARPAGRRRRPRRGTVERPVNARLVRASAVLVAPALLAVLFSVSATGSLPAPPLEPLFDPSAATALADELSADFPSRIPGTPEAQDASRWFADTIAAFGFATEEDRWVDDVPGLGRVELRNVTTVIPGRAPAAVLVVAHRDNAGPERASGDNATGTAALIEIARGYAPQGTINAPRPQRTLVLVSTDGGAYGGAGAARFARSSPYADDAFAAVVLDGLGGLGRPALAISGDEPRSPAPALVRTAVARVEEHVGVEPELPSLLEQLVGLGIPYADGEQGRFLAAGIAALSLTSEPDGGAAVFSGDGPRGIDAQRLGDLGKASEALLGSIDARLGAAFRTPDTIFLGNRAASGWAVRLMLLVAVVPFVLGAADLLVRSRRRGLPLAPAWRALRTRGLLWLYAGLLLWLAGVSGILPTGAALPIPPDSSVVRDRPAAGLALLALALVAGWVLARQRLHDVRHRTTSEERLAGYSVGLTWLALVAVAVGILRPYSLVFVLPSLYAWLWLPLVSSLWARSTLFAAGFVGPVVGLVVLPSDLDLSLPRAVLYVLGLATLGYVPVSAVVLVLAWAAAATQLGALAFGRYAPYAAGVEPPPPGVLRRTLAAMRRSRASYSSAR